MTASFRFNTTRSLVGGILLASSGAFAAPQEGTPAAPPAPAAPATTTATATNLPTAKELIDKHVAALGGAEAIESVISTRYKASLETPMGKMDVDLATKKPRKILFRQDMAGMGAQEFGCDGEIGWTTSPLSPEPQLLGREMVEQAADGADLQSLVREIAKRFNDFTVLDRVSFQGADAYKVRMAHNSGQQMNAFFDAEKGLMRALQIESDTPQGPMMQTMVLSDWEKVGPVLVFKTMSMEQMGMTMTMRFTDFEFNTLEDAHFNAPPKVVELAKDRESSQSDTRTSVPTGPRPADR